jgi:hypothetical protein
MAASRSPPLKEHHMIRDILIFGIGALVGGAACAVSAKVFGFFNKQVKAIETKIP